MLYICAAASDCTQECSARHPHALNVSCQAMPCKAGRIVKCQPVKDTAVVERVSVPVGILAALVLRQNEPMAPHHVQCLWEMLEYRPRADLLQIVRTGKMEVVS